MIAIGEGIAVDEGDLAYRFIRASGPGGQHVNKVATAVELRFDLGRARSLPPAVRDRLARLAGSRLSHDRILIITARRYRSQERNRQDALARLIRLIRRAAQPPRPRRPTEPTAASRERRLAAKAHRSRRKQDRTQPTRDPE